MIKQSYSAKIAALSAAVAILAMPFTPVLAKHKVKAGTQIFQGLVEHISSSNLKVMNPATKQTLAFLLVPHFKKIFKGGSQTTQQMAALKEGQFVKVYFDQKALGARHADRIIILDNANMAMGKLKG